MVLLIKLPVAQAQEVDMRFLDFLMSSGRYQQVLDMISLETSWKQEEQFDSLNFNAGLAHYYLKRIEPAIASWRKVSTGSPLYLRSGLFGSWSLAYTGKYPESKQWLTSLISNDSLELGLIRHESLGLLLLQRKFAEYPPVRQTMDPTYYIWSESLQHFDQHLEELRLFKPKHGWLAGLSSAIVPGLGKVYTGDLGAGISSFLSCGALGALTVENGMKSGWTHWSTLFFGSLFTLFYTGNIYGSVINVKHYREDFYIDMDQRILWDMHIPIREFYR